MTIQDVLGRVSTAGGPKHGTRCELVWFKVPSYTHYHLPHGLPRSTLTYTIPKAHSMSSYSLTCFTLSTSSSPIIRPPTACSTSSAICAREREFVVIFASPLPFSPAPPSDVLSSDWLTAPSPVNGVGGGVLDLREDPAGGGSLGFDAGNESRRAYQIQKPPSHPARSS